MVSNEEIHGAKIIGVDYLSELNRTFATRVLLQKGRKFYQIIPHAVSGSASGCGGHEWMTIEEWRPELPRNAR